MKEIIVQRILLYRRGKLSNDTQKNCKKQTHTHIINEKRNQIKKEA